MYIITKTWLRGEYPPSLVDTAKEAHDILYNLTAEHIRVWKIEKFAELKDMSDEEVVNWAKANIKEGFNFSEYGAEFYYDDEDMTYDIITVYNTDDLS